MQRFKPFTGFKLLTIFFGLCRFCFQRRFIHPDAFLDPRIIEIPSFFRWQEKIDELSEEALYIIFPSSTGDYRIQAVPVTPTSFQPRKPFCNDWAGKRDAELASITGVEDVIFCHPNAFIFGTLTLEAARQIARLAVAD